MANELLTGTTESGFEYSVDTRRLADFRYLSAVSKLQKSAEAEDEMEMINSLVFMIEFLLGKNQSDRLMEHIASLNDGVAPVDKVMAVYTEICNHKAVKN